VKRNLVGSLLVRLVWTCKGQIPLEKRLTWVCLIIIGLLTLKFESNELSHFKIDFDLSAFNMVKK